jgi:hypothetical protein
MGKTMMKKIKKYVIIMNQGNQRLSAQPEGPSKRRTEQHEEPSKRRRPFISIRQPTRQEELAHEETAYPVELNQNWTKNMIHTTYRINKDKLRPIGKGSQSIVFTVINDDRYIYKVIDPSNLQRAFKWNPNTVSRFVANYCFTQSELKTYLEEHLMINLVPNEECSVVNP